MKTNKPYTPKDYERDLAFKETVENYAIPIPTIPLPQLIECLRFHGISNAKRRGEQGLSLEEAPKKRILELIVERYELACKRLTSPTTQPYHQKNKEIILNPSKTPKKQQKQGLLFPL